MLAVVELEFIGENYYAYKRTAAAASDRTERYGDYLGHDRSRPWVARLVGLDARYGFARQFQRARIDYSRANAVGSRRVFLYFHLRDGMYEINERVTWRRVRRYCIRVREGKIEEISREEAKRCLQNGD